MNRFENQRATAIIRRAKETHDPKSLLTDHALSKVIRVTFVNLYLYFAGQRKWSLETWIDTLAAIGALKYDSKRKKITIDVELTETEKSHLKACRRRAIMRIKKQALKKQINNVWQVK